YVGFLNGLKKPYFAFVGERADLESDLRAAIRQLGRNADHSNAGRQRVFQIGEDFRPWKTALVDQRVEECRSVENLPRARAAEIISQGLLAPAVGLDGGFQVGD